MGRPIKKKFFGNTNIAITGEGVGGEQVASVLLATTGTGWSTTTNVTWVASAPQLPGGQAASGSATIVKTAENGWASGFTVTDGGSGYTSTSSVTLTFSPVPTGAGSYVVVLNPSATLQNAIRGSAYLLAKDGGVSSKTYDIVKQEASHRYLVRTADGIGQCKLVASNSPGAGEMNLIATDTYGSTYWVMKLTARRAILRQRSMSGSYAFANNARAGWTLGSASTGIVSITNA
jgi:hypothetical protein